MKMAIDIGHSNLLRSQRELTMCLSCGLGATDKSAPAKFRPHGGTRLPAGHTSGNEQRTFWSNPLSRLTMLIPSKLVRTNTAVPDDSNFPEISERGTP